ncbi:MAG: hypothetical protein AAGF90_20760, partial [Pseudomonadota bacterium]
MIVFEKLRQLTAIAASFAASKTASDEKTGIGVASTSTEAAGATAPPLPAFAAATRDAPKPEVDPKPGLVALSEAETIMGGDGAETFSGGDGDDAIFGAGGADTLRGGRDDDLID